MHLLACKYNYHNDAIFTDTPYPILRSLKQKYLLLTGQNPSHPSTKEAGLPICTTYPGFEVLGQGGGIRLGPVWGGERDEVL